MARKQIRLRLSLLAFTVHNPPRYQKIKTLDYDSIVNFILTSGILNIDLNYSKPATPNGIEMFISGGCSYQYIIETSEGELVLLIFGSQVFKLPEILSEFDRLFKRIAGRYPVEIR